MGVIRFTLSKNVAHKVVKEKSTMGLIKVLSNIYEKSSVNSKVFLMRKFFNLKMVEGASVATHFNVFNMIVNQLSFVEIDFDYKIHALILVVSLPNSWEPMRAAISHFVGSVKLNFNNVID